MFRSTDTRLILVLGIAGLGILIGSRGGASGAEPRPNVDYASKVAPILKKYCAACHNADDREGKLSLETFADLQKGGKRGPVVLANQPDSSRLIRVLTGASQPKMPPEGNDSPSPLEIGLLRSWIEAGAKGPDGSEPDNRELLVPKIAPTRKVGTITSLAYSPNGKHLATGRYGAVEVSLAESGQAIRTLDGLPGKINAIHFSSDGGKIVAASGVPGLHGQAQIWNVESGERMVKMNGHRDAMFDAEFSPDGTLLATCSYDRKIIIWNAVTGEQIRVIEGHNDAVYDLAFHPSGKLLASASGDKTVKIWQVSSGQRLDTLSQPQGEQYSVLFSPDGKFVVSGGVDNRIRVWRITSFERPEINPLIYARFGHEGPIVRLAFSDTGSHLLSASQDRSVKLWETDRFTEVRLFDLQSDDITDIASRPSGVSSAFPQFTLSRADGAMVPIKLSQFGESTARSDSATSTPVPIALEDSPVDAAEAEPNDTPAESNFVALPVKIRGLIHAHRQDQQMDVDVFRFQARAGQEWVFEVNAERQKSPLDSRIEVLDRSGRPIERVVLQAIRDSYFTFRGKDSNTSDDYRIHNWQEMELNDFLYSDGEVVKLWLYPRGPDSGFKVYPGAGKRWTYFDTTPVAHALFAPCYVVRPYPPGTTLIPNGLPIIPVYYENDDDSQRQLGADSRLTFTTPYDGEFVARILDARGFQGEDYKYDLIIRNRQPDFKVTVGGTNPTVNAGGGKEFSVTAERMDGFDGEIRVQVEGLPPGFAASQPLIIESGQTTALGTITADPSAAQPTAENSKISKLVASAVVNGKSVTHEIGSLGEIKLAEKSKVVVSIHSTAGPTSIGSTSTGASSAVEGTSSPRVMELFIKPGQTISATVRVERNGFEGRIPLGGADAGRNLPHGVYVDNIGLNGLMIVEGQHERTFFITAAKIATETSRPFHLRAEVEGNQTSVPVMIHVRN